MVKVKHTLATPDRPHNNLVPWEISVALSRFTCTGRLIQSTMAPSYKLTYFNVTGLGEPIRYLLSLAKIDFVDDRVEFENFSAIKAGKFVWPAKI